MKNIAEMSKAEYNRLYPVEHCPKHGAYRCLCMGCEKEWDLFISRQEFNKAWSEETNRRNR